MLSFLFMSPPGISPVTPMGQKVGNLRRAFRNFWPGLNQFEVWVKAVPKLLDSSCFELDSNPFQSSQVYDQILVTKSRSIDKDLY